MDYLPGVTARCVFASLNAEQQHHILDTLVSYVEQLVRSIPHPCPSNSWIGTASRRAFWDPVVSDEDPEDGWWPYVDLAAFNDARVALFDKFARIHPPITDQLRDYRRDMRDDLPVVFTHADIHRENVLLKQSSDGTQVDVLALLDWGCAGWRPIFWEVYKSAWLGHNFKIWGELGG